MCALARCDQCFFGAAMVAQGGCFVLDEESPPGHHVEHLPKIEAAVALAGRVLLKSLLDISRREKGTSGRRGKLGPPRDREVDR